MRSPRLAIRVIGPSISYISLTKGQFALVDWDDATFLENSFWNATWNPCIKSFYAVRSRKNQESSMARFLLKAGCQEQVDHINRNTLDNRRLGNLRLVSRSQNCMNRTVQNKTGFPGVIQREYGYLARINIEGKQLYLGTFPSAEEAFASYKAAHLKYYKEFSIYFQK